MTVEDIGAYYDKMANEGYDDIYGGVVCKAEDQVLMAAVKRNMGAGSILDVGCGTGLVSSYLEGDKRYTGIDISLKELQTATEKEKDPKRNFLLADMHKLPFFDQTFSTLISAFGPYSYSLTPENLLEEFSRVVKPGGKFVIMPYTERTGKSIGLGGFSTAVEPSIRKIFYTEEYAKEIFSKLKNLEVFGINYLPNILLPKLNAEKQKNPVSEATLNHALEELFSQMGQKRNFDSFKQGIALVNLWRSFVADQSNAQVLSELLFEEIRVYKDIIPAHFARHMLITGEKG